MTGRLIIGTTHPVSRLPELRSNQRFVFLDMGDADVVYRIQREGSGFIATSVRPQYGGEPPVYHWHFRPAEWRGHFKLVPSQVNG